MGKVKVKKKKQTARTYTKKKGYDGWKYRSFQDFADVLRFRTINVINENKKNLKQQAMVRKLKLNGMIKKDNGELVWKPRKQSKEYDPMFLLDRGDNLRYGADTGEPLTTASIMHYMLVTSDLKERKGKGMITKDDVHSVCQNYLKGFDISENVQVKVTGKGGKSKNSKNENFRIINVKFDLVTPK